MRHTRQTQYPGVSSGLRERGPRWASGCALAAIVVSAVVLCGWAFGAEVLTYGVPGGAEMVANTAIATLLLAVSLLLVTVPGGRRPRLARGLALAAAAIGALTIAEYVSGGDLGIDELLFEDPADVEHPGRPSSTSALAMLFGGLALVAIDRRAGEVDLLREALLGGFLVMVLLSTVGYLYDVDTVRGSAAASGVSAPTALVLVLLAAGVLLARPGQSWVALLTSDGTAGTAARYLVPAAIVVPVTLGLIRLELGRAEVIGVEAGITLLTVAAVSLLLGVGYFAATSVGRASAELREARDQLADANVSLEGANEDLARLNADLSQFVAFASHDLSEPVRTIKGFSELLAERYGDELDERGRGYLEHLLDASGRMRTQIDAVLDYMRTGRVELEWREVDLDASFERITSVLGSSLRRSGAAVSHEHLPRVWADRNLLEVLLQNLVANAIKYTPEDRPPEIVASAGREGAMWRIEVADRGEGVEPRFAERIFEPFERLHPPGDVPGAGIGLALCKRIVERHGGTLGVDARPDGGSVFWFTLPGRRGGG